MSSPHDNLAARLLEPAVRNGRTERVALRQGDRAITYGELSEQIARMASGLRSLGVQPDQRVAVLMRDSIEAAVAILGIVHLGAVAVPLSELVRPLDLREYISHSGASAVVTEAALEPAIHAIRAEVPALRLVVCSGPVSSEHAGVHDLAKLLAHSAPASEPAATGADRVALLLYSTIGTEHDLRGIPHVHATPMAAFESFARGVIALGPGDRVLSTVRLSTVYGLSIGLLFPLAAGAEALLLPQQPHSETVFEAVRTFDPTVFLATPSVYGQLARDAEATDQTAALAHVRVCLSGAEGMPPGLIPRIREVLGTEVMVGYGLTEAFQFVFASGLGDSTSDGPPGNVGRPVPGFEARVVDDAGNPLGPNVIGLLQIRGPTVLSSYWGRAAAAQPEPFRDGWFTTRDRFMTDESGRFFFCGRVDDLFKVGGKWVSPTEVERALLAHEEVWDCAVIGADDEDGLSKPFAFVVPNIGHAPGPDLESKLRQAVKRELAPYKYPRWIEFRDKLPRGPGGKLLRYKLRPQRTDRQAETAADDS